MVYRPKARAPNDAPSLKAVQKYQIMYELRPAQEAEKNLQYHFRGSNRNFAVLTIERVEPVMGCRPTQPRMCDAFKIFCQTVFCKTHSPWGKM